VSRQPPQVVFGSLLERLGICSGDLVYLHTSFSRLRHLDLTPEELLSGLLVRLGPSGTLVVPSFAWNLDRTQRPWKGYADYFAMRPVFDVRNTPANIGLVPEMFRQWPGVRRSVHFWWSVTAKGPLADDITDRQQSVVHPYGPDSAFGRLTRLGAKILGLGVSLNTTSLAPVVDHELGPIHTQTLFTEELQDGVVIDEQGRRLVTRAFWLLPEVVRCIKPSELIARSERLQREIRRADVGETIQFAYRFDAYLEEGLRLGRDAAARHARMPWLEGYPVMRSPSGEAGKGDR
jgi:hypothetical protein